MTDVRAELLSIGTELLLGQIVDTNSAYLAGRLAVLGIDLLHMSTVGDNLGRATGTLRQAIERSDLIVCTGGLGPTEDDLTREAIAAAVGETPTLGQGSVLRSRTLKLLGIGESSVEEALGELVRSTAPTVATYAKNDGVHVRITDKGDDVAAVMARIEGMDALIRGRVGEYVWG